MPIIIPANSASSGAFEVANSLMLNNPGDAATLSRSNSSGTSTQKGTISVWVKGGEEPSGNNQTTLASWGDANNHGALLWNGSDKIDAFDYQSGYASQLQTNAVLRDSSAWYHIVYSWDTTLATADDRQKIYINGVEQTYSTRTNYSQNAATSWNANSYSVRVGALNSSSYFRGYMAEVVFIDGTQYAASDFGEFEEDSKIWQPIDVSGLTFGTNGAYLDFEDSANLGNDANGGTDFSETNLAATDQGTDTCTNNFIILNPLNAYFTNSTFSDGNTTFASGSSYSGTTAGILLDTGKWYWEVKVISKTGDGDNYAIGIQGQEATGTNQFVGGQLFGYQIYGGNGQIYNNNSGATYAAAYTAGDIIGVALDLTNNKLYYSKNGDWSNGSGAWSSSTFDAAVGAKAITAPATVTLGGYYPSQTFWSGSSGTFSMNFGSPYFAISSGNSDGNGYGNFEYPVPTGFLSLNTKNLGSDGG